MIKEIFKKELAKKGYVKGRYIHLGWVSESDSGYRKESNGIVRIFNVKDCNNGHTLAVMRITKNSRQKVKVVYSLNGEIISEEEYYKHNERKEITEWFSKRIEDIVKVY